jgi:hypothetical protein
MRQPAPAMGVFLAGGEGGFDQIILIGDPAQFGQDDGAQLAGGKLRQIGTCAG